MTDITPSASIRINFKKEEMERIMFLMKHNSEPSTHSLIRFLIADKYQKTKDSQLKYGSSAPKPTYAEKTEKIKAMDDEELTKYLYDMDIFKDSPMDGASNVTISYRMGRDQANRIEFVKYTYQDKQFPPYENPGRDLDEIINKLIKEKRI